MITVVTPTVGRSARRLDVLLREMRKFTRLPFEQIVSDDGTLDEGAVREQEEVCKKYGAIHTRNFGPSFGLPANLNHAADQVKTHWFYVVEDGVRPSWGWLEAIQSYLNKLEGKTFAGMRVSMVGVNHIEDYALALGGAIPQPQIDTFIPKPSQQRTKEARECFYGDWNDGLWCWPRLLTTLRSIEPSSLGEEARDARAMLERVRTDPRHYSDALHWPYHRGAFVAYAPGGLIAVDTQVWRDLGRFRKDLSYYEGHLGVRIAKAGMMSLLLHGPLWLHSPSQGFSDPLTHSMYQSREVKNLHPHDVFQEDFGFKSVTAGMPLFFSQRHREAWLEIATIQADAVPEWNAWTTSSQRWEPV